MILAGACWRPRSRSLDHRAEGTRIMPKCARLLPVRGPVSHDSLLRPSEWVLVARIAHMMGQCRLGAEFEGPVASRALV